METQIKQLSSCEKQVDVTVPYDELEPDFQTAFKKFQKSAKLSGFRKGKVPRKVLEKMYGDAIRADVLETILNKYYGLALKAVNLHPLSEGNITDIIYEPNQPLQFSIQLEITPEFSVEKLSKLKVKREKQAVNDALIDQELERVRYQAARQETVEGAAEKGHYILADLQQLEASSKLPLLGHKWDDRYFELGKGMLGEDFEEQLLGVKAGESRMVTRVNAPDPVNPQAPQNSEEFYKVSVKKVENVILPALDDDLAKDVDQDLHTLGALKERIGDRLQYQAGIDADSRLKQALENEVVKQFDFDVPERMLKNYLDRMIEDMKKNGREGIDEAVIKSEYRPLAIQHLKWFLIRSKLIEANHLAVEASEIDQQIELLAKASNMKPEQIQTTLGSRRAREQIQEQILETKVTNLLKANAKIEEVELG